MNDLTTLILTDQLTRDLYERAWWQPSARDRRRPRRPRRRRSLRVVLRRRPRLAAA